MTALRPGHGNVEDPLCVVELNNGTQLVLLRQCRTCYETEIRLRVNLVRVAGHTRHRGCLGVASHDPQFHRVCPNGGVDIHNGSVKPRGYLQSRCRECDNGEHNYRSYCNPLTFISDTVSAISFSRRADALTTEEVRPGVEELLTVDGPIHCRICGREATRRPSGYSNRGVRDERPVALMFGVGNRSASIDHTLPGVHHFGPNQQLQVTCTGCNLLYAEYQPVQRRLLDSLVARPDTSPFQAPDPVAPDHPAEEMMMEDDAKDLFDEFELQKLRQIWCDMRSNHTNPGRHVEIGYIPRRLTYSCFLRWVFWQGNRCAYTGLIGVWSANGALHQRHNPGRNYGIVLSLSVDRIVPGGDYLPHNMQVVLKAVNFAKCTFPDAEARAHVNEYVLYQQLRRDLYDANNHDWDAVDALLQQHGHFSGPIDSVRP